MNIALNDGNDFSNRMSDGFQRERFIGPDRQQIEGAKEQAGLHTQQDG